MYNLQARMNRGRGGNRGAVLFSADHKNWKQYVTTCGRGGEPPGICTQFSNLQSKVTKKKMTSPPTWNI
jgi:hypothetical protein